MGSARSCGGIWSGSPGGTAHLSREEAGGGYDGPEPSVSPLVLLPVRQCPTVFSCLLDSIQIGRSSYPLQLLLSLSDPPPFPSSYSSERFIHLLRSQLYERRVFPTHSYNIIWRQCLRNSTEAGPHFIMATGFVFGRQLFIYSLLIVANESKRIEIRETNQDDRLRLRKHSCVSSRAGHLGALPGLFVDHQDGIDGCDHDHGPAPSFSAPQNGSTVKGHHGAPAQLHCNIQDLHHRAVGFFYGVVVVFCSLVPYRPGYNLGVLLFLHRDWTSQLPSRDRLLVVMYQEMPRRIK